MTSGDERLAVRMGRARSRFVEDAVSALKEAAPSERSRADIEEALQEGIGHGRKLLHRAELACRRLASSVGLQPDTSKEMSWHLAVTAKALRDLQEVVAAWTRSRGQPLEGEESLGLLIAELDDRRAELSLGRGEPPGVTLGPTFDQEQVGRARAAYERGDFEDLEEVIRGLQGPPPQDH